MERKVHLKGRLSAISDYVENSSLAADIGCDHGRLCVSLLQSGKTQYAYASDISEPSLKKAKLLCEKCCMQDRMMIRSTDGLVGIEKQPDTIIIAGMGGILISEIMEKSPDISHSAEHLILQPMRGIIQLRKYLHMSGYHIIRDKICEEAGRLYQILDVCYKGEKQRIEIIPEGTYDIGEYMLKVRDPLLPRYIKILENELTQALYSMEGTTADASELKKRISALHKISEVYENES